MLCRLPKYDPKAKKWEPGYYVTPDGKVELWREGVGEHIVHTPDGKKMRSWKKSPYHLVAKALFIAKKFGDEKASDPLADEARSLDRWMGAYTRKGKKPIKVYAPELLKAIEDRYHVKLKNVSKVKAGDINKEKIKKLTEEKKSILSSLEAYPTCPKDVPEAEFKRWQNHIKKRLQKIKTEIKALK